jgi:hypothetical protein
MNTLKGRFVPKFPKKYKGDSSNIIYRSSWERKCMVYFDQHPDVVQWLSEEVVVPYKSPIDGRYHRYFPDFVVKVRSKEGEISTIMVEVKPFRQTKEPVKQNRLTKKYITEVHNYAINIHKWEAAKRFCADRNWKFMIITENELKIK